MTVAVAVAVCAVFAASASARVGGSAARHGSSRTVTEWTSTYDASSYYGAVTCTGKTIVDAKYPEGRDVETCETTEGKFSNMEAGRGQTSFKSASGGTVGEWESDSGDGKRTTDFSYSVNKKETKFKIVAIY
jgi:hypothetical protein